jgi:hypothetical protein
MGVSIIYIEKYKLNKFGLFSERKFQKINSKENKRKKKEKNHKVQKNKKRLKCPA